QRPGGIALTRDRSLQFVGLDIPNLDQRTTSETAPRAGQAAAVGAEGHGLALRRRAEDDGFLAAGAVVEVDAAAAAGAREGPVPAESKAEHGLGIAAKDQRLARLNLVPNADQAVAAARRQFPILAEGYGQDLGDAVMNAHELAARNIVEADF